MAQQHQLRADTAERRWQPLIDAEVRRMQADGIEFLCPIVVTSVERASQYRNLARAARLLLRAPRDHSERQRGAKLAKEMRALPNFLGYLKGRRKDEAPAIFEPQYQPQQRGKKPSPHIVIVARGEPSPAAIRQLVLHEASHMNDLVLRRSIAITLKFNEDVLKTLPPYVLRGLQQTVKNLFDSQATHRRRAQEIQAESHSAGGLALLGEPIANHLHVESPANRRERSAWRNAYYHRSKQNAGMVAAYDAAVRTAFAGQVREARPENKQLYHAYVNGYRDGLSEMRRAANQGKPPLAESKLIPLLLRSRNPIDQASRVLGNKLAVHWAAMKGAMALWSWQVGQFAKSLRYCTLNRLMLDPRFDHHWQRLVELNSDSDLPRHLELWKAWQWTRPIGDNSVERWMGRIDALVGVPPHVRIEKLLHHPGPIPEPAPRRFRKLPNAAPGEPITFTKLN